MARDRARPLGVAWVLAAVGACGPQVRPDRPFPEEAVIHRERPPAKVKPGRQVVVGELCLRSAAGRPAVAPLLLRTDQWIDAVADVHGAVDRGAAPRFVAYGVDGKVAGRFDTIGLAELALGQAVAAGTYVGGPPCSADGGSGARLDDARCAAATAGCGLAVAELVRPGELPDGPGAEAGGACVSGDALVVDIDGDGVAEAFPLAGVLDGIRGPAAEWSASATARPACAPRFTTYDVALAREAEGGKAADPKATVMLDVLGVADLDGDGRRELVLALRFPMVRTIVVYTATASAQRLELAGEAQSFQK